MTTSDSINVDGSTVAILDHIAELITARAHEIKSPRLDGRPRTDNERRELLGYTRALEDVRAAVLSIAAGRDVSAIW